MWNHHAVLMFGRKMPAMWFDRQRGMNGMAWILK